MRVNFLPTGYFDFQVKRDTSRRCPILNPKLKVIRVKTPTFSIPRGSSMYTFKSPVNTSGTRPFGLGTRVRKESDETGHYYPR